MPLQDRLLLTIVKLCDALQEDLANCFGVLVSTVEL